MHQKFRKNNLLLLFFFSVWCFLKGPCDRGVFHLSIYDDLLVLHRTPLHINSIATSQLTTSFLSSFRLRFFFLNNPECQNWPGTKHTPFLWDSFCFSLRSCWWLILNSFSLSLSFLLHLSLFDYWSWTHELCINVGGRDFIDDWILIMLDMFYKVHCWPVFFLFYLCIFLKM